MGNFSICFSLGSILAAGSILFPLHWIWTVPTGFSLQEGAALAPVQNADGTFVIESGHNALIDWESFSIAEGERVQFNQADVNSCVLNRVMGFEASQILGDLSSNGVVHLINPNGILIGSEAHIETAGFIASTLGWLGEDLAGKRFVGDSDQRVVNEGIIHCFAGDVFLIGRTVENNGQIITENGKQGLLSGCDVLVRPLEAPQVWIRPGDEIIDKEEYAENPYALAIRHAGRMEAKSAEGGAIYLVADEGLCEVSGSAAAKSGTVHVLGDAVHIQDGADIDVSGDSGGGTILVGGDYQGKNPEIKNATAVQIDQEARLKANALVKGNGGKVIIWSDRETCYYGDIGMEGGPEGGDGGFAEVSGKLALSFQGTASGKAPLGKAGSILLDPTDITISGTSPATGGSFSAGVWTSAANSATIPATTNASSVSSLLNGGTSVTINSSTGGFSGTGNIIVSSAISWTTSNSLTLIADAQITVNAAITNTTAAGSISFTATGAATGTYDGIDINAAISAVGNISLTGTGGTAGGHGISFGAGGSVTVNNTATVTGTGGPSSTNYFGIYFSAGNLTIGNGANCNLIGQGGTGTSSDYFGIEMIGGSVTVGDGATFILQGTGGGGNAGGGSNYGIDLSGTTFTLGTSTGATATFTGVGGNGPNGNNYGVNINSAINANGSSSSIIFSNCQGGGTGGGNSSNNHGVFLSAAITTPGSVLFGNITGGGSGMGGNNYGLGLNNTITASTIGMQVGATIQGGGTSSSTGANFGIFFESGSITGNTSITTTISLTGAGAPGVGGTNNQGILFGNATLNIANGGTVILNGTGSNSPSISLSQTNHGINLATGTMNVGTLAGSGTTVVLTGVGGNTVLGSSYGVEVQGGFTFTVPGTATIEFLNCQGGPSVSGTSNIGVLFGGSALSSSPGNVTFEFNNITGGSGSQSPGVVLILNGVPAASTLNISCNGLTGGTGNQGYALYYQSNITATSGAFTMTNCNGGSGLINEYGVYVQGNVILSWPTITATAITGGGNMLHGIGFYVSNGAKISSSSPTGAISITATGSSAGTLNTGIQVDNGASIIASSSATITLNGTGGGGSGSNYGIYVNGGTLQTASGNLSLSGTPGSNTTEAIAIIGSSTISSGSGTINFNSTSPNSIGLGPCTISSTTGPFHFNGPVFLTGTISSVTSAPITFNSTIDGAQSLTLNAGLSTITLSGAVGSSTPLSSLTIASPLSLGGNITTGTLTLPSSYGVTLTTSSTITTTAGSILFPNTIVGNGQSLTLTTSSQNGVTLSGNVGLIGTPLGVLTVSAGASSLTLSSTLSNIYASSFIVGNSTTPVPTTLSTGSFSITTTGAISFSGAISGAGVGLTLNAGSGPITLGNNVTLASLAFNSGNTGTLNLGNSSTASTISLSSAGFFVPSGAATVLAGNITVNTSGSNITFNNTINGAYSLTLQGGAGIVTLGAAVGGSVPLASLTATATGSGTIVQSSTVTTVGSTSYIVASTGLSSLANNLTTSSGAMNFTGPVQLTGAVTMDTTASGMSAGANIDFIDATTTINGAQGLTLTAGTGTVLLNGNVGTMGTPLGAFIVSSNTAELSLIPTLSTIFASSFTVRGSVPTVLGSGGAFTITTGGAISFGGTVTGSANLTLRTAGIVTLSGNVGTSGTPLGILDITAGGLVFPSGVSSIYAGSFALHGSSSSTTIGNASLLIDTHLGNGNISFAGPVSGTTNLTLYPGTGGITFGSTASLTSLTFTSGDSLSLGGNVTLPNNPFATPSGMVTTLTGSVGISTGTGAISFLGTIVGAAANSQNLTLTTSGAVSLGGSIGSASVPLGNIVLASTVIGVSILTPLTSIFANSFSVDAPVPTQLETGGSFSIQGGSGAGAIVFGGTVNGAAALTLSAGSSGIGAGAGAITLFANVGMTQPLSAFTLSGGNLIFEASADLIVAGSISLGGGTATTLGAGTTLFDTHASNGNLLLAGSIDGSTGYAESLTITAGTGSVNAIGLIGETTPLDNINIQSAGVVDFTTLVAASSFTVNNSGTFSFLRNADLSNYFSQSGSGPVNLSGSITTNGGNIGFNSATTLVGNTTLEIEGSTGTILFSQTIDGGFNLTLDGGAISFGGAVGSGIRLANILVISGSTISVNGDQTVFSGTMEYNGNVILNGASQFLNTGPGGIFFSAPSGDAISGNYDLSLIANHSSINVQGDISLIGGVGFSGGSLTVNSGLSALFGGQILTQGDNSGGSVTIVSSNGSVSVHNINTSGGIGTAGNITLQPASADTGGYPNGLIILNEDLSSGGEGNLVAGTASAGGGVITLSAHRVAFSEVATITSGSENNVYISGAACDMGIYEAMTVLGSLEFDCTTVTLGDLVALDALTITAATTNLNTHGDIQILASNGLLYTSPSLHFIGGSTYAGPTGTIIPSDPTLLNGQGLGLSESAFKPQLFYNGTVLNYDTSPKPSPPSPPPAPSLSSRQFSAYQLVVADAQLSDMLPIFQSPLEMSVTEVISQFYGETPPRWRKRGYRIGRY